METSQAGPRFVGCAAIYIGIYRVAQGRDVDARKFDRQHGIDPSCVSTDGADGRNELVADLPRHGIDWRYRHAVVCGQVERIYQPDDFLAAADSLAAGDFEVWGHDQWWTKLRVSIVRGQGSGSRAGRY